MIFSKPYNLKGKHATYIRFLNENTRRLNKDAKVAELFTSAVEIYVVAPLIGVAYNKRSPIDSESQDDYWIPGEQIINHQKLIDAVYRLVLLSERSTDLSSDECIERTFKTDEEPEKLEANLDLFHQYMRGGIEWLYDTVTDGATTQEDYLDKVRELVIQYSDDFELLQVEEISENF